MLCLWILVTLELTLGSKGYHREDTFLKKKKDGIYLFEREYKWGRGERKGAEGQGDSH